MQNAILWILRCYCSAHTVQIFNSHFTSSHRDDIEKTIREKRFWLCMQWNSTMQCSNRMNYMECIFAPFNFMVTNFLSVCHLAFVLHTLRTFFGWRAKQKQKKVTNVFSHIISISGAIKRRIKIVRTSKWTDNLRRASLRSGRPLMFTF